MKVPKSLRRLASTGTRRAILLLGATVLLASCVLSQAGSGWNVNSRVDLVRAVVEHGELNIDRYHDQSPYDTQDEAVYGGHFYSDKTIGMVVLGVPVYAVARTVASAAGRTLGYSNVLWVLSHAVSSLAAALAAMLMATLLIRLGAVPRRAILVTAGVFFGSMLFGYGTVFMPYLPGIACCLGALVLVLDPPLTTRHAVVAVGGLLGFALILDLTFVFVVLIVAALLLAELLRVERPRAIRLGAVVAGTTAVPLAAFFAYCIVLFGSPSIPYRYEYNTLFRTSMAKGLMGATTPKPVVMWFLSFHAYRGILFWSPWLLMVFVCWVWIWRHDRGLRPVALASAFAFVTYFLWTAGYYMWWGGSAMGPRLMLPMFAIVPLALVPACRAKAPRWLWPALLATLAIATALCMPLSLADPQTTEGNPVTLLLHAGLGTHIHVPQLDALGNFYGLHWTRSVPRSTASLLVHWSACLALMVGGTWLAFRTAKRTEAAGVLGADPAGEADPAAPVTAGS